MVNCFDNNCYQNILLFHIKNHDDIYIGIERQKTIYIQNQIFSKIKIQS